jgi:hypothetical protein
MLNAECCLLRFERRVAHAELCADVFGEEFESRAVGFGIGFDEIAHGLHEQSLAFNVGGIGAALPLQVFSVGTARNYKYFGQKNLSKVCGTELRLEAGNVPLRCLIEREYNARCEFGQ